MKVPALSLATLKIDIAFYDDNEKQKLLAYPTAATMQALVSQPVEIPRAEFLTYYLFHHIKVGKPGYRDYDTVARKVHLWLSAIGECIDYDGDSVRTPQGASRQLIEVSEHVGEAIGLSVMNRIHGLTEADWAPIPEQRGRSAKPSFDFQVASDGKHFVQVETKGSSVPNNRVLSDAVKAQKRKIDKKKEKLAELAKNGKDPYPAAFRYGTITVVDHRKDGNVRCLLTDPPPDQFAENPANFRLISRLENLRDWVSFIGPRSPFAAALASRVAALKKLKSPFDLDDVPLERGTGESFEIEPYGFPGGKHSSFMSSKSRVVDDPSGGVVIQLSDDALFFFGIREELLVKASKQSLEELFHYEARVRTERKVVECKFSRGRFERLTLPASIEEDAEELGGYMQFELSGDLHYSREGLVFGILPLPEE